MKRQRMLKDCLFDWLCNVLFFAKFTFVGIGVVNPRIAEATDVMAMLVQTHDEDGEKLSDDNLIGHAFALYVAGHETTANALTWINFLLAQHPHSLADLLDELDAKLHGAPPTVAQLSQLPLLEGVVKEDLRLFPPAMIGLRIATEACELGGFELAANTNILFAALSRPWLI